MEKGKVFISGVVSGLVLGAVTALLLAPKSGSELRSDVKDVYNRSVDRVKSLRKGQGVVETQETENA